MSRHDRRRAGRAFGLVVVAVMGLAGSCRTVPRTEPQVVPSAPPPTADLRVPPPVIRVGVVVDAARASVAADSGVVLTVRDGEAREERVARATFAALSTGAAEAGRFRVQVASLADPAAARDAGARAEKIAGQASAVRWNPETRTHQVRVGAYATRPLALEAVGKLHLGGLPGSFVVEDAPAGTARIRLLETGREYRTVLVAPSEPGETLTIDGAPYRGLVEVRSTPEGTVTVVNVAEPRGLPARGGPERAVAVRLSRSSRR